MPDQQTLRVLHVEDDFHDREADRRHAAERWPRLHSELGIVVGYSELILQDLDKNHALRTDLEEILKAAQEAMELISRFDAVD